MHFPQQISIAIVLFVLDIAAAEEIRESSAREESIRILDASDQRVSFDGQILFLTALLMYDPNK